jgi:hypothetical protein
LREAALAIRPGRRLYSPASFKAHTVVGLPFSPVTSSKTPWRQSYPMW